MDELFTTHAFEGIRRIGVLGGIGAPLVARAQTAEFTYKYANNLPDATR